MRGDTLGSAMAGLSAMLRRRAIWRREPLACAAKVAYHWAVAHDQQRWDERTEQCVALAGGFRLIQRRRGHRYSVDDMLVAHLAGTQGGAPRRVLDLGCGLGSVLLINAWRFPGATLVGLEALDQHVAYARRNVQLNSCQDRISVVAGDLRDEALVRSLGTFDLVTGTPPYFDPTAGTLCADPARAAAHFELRGGVEQYARAARWALGPGGLFVTCAGAVPPGRGTRALDQAGLHALRRQEVLPREGKPAFLELLVASAEHGLTAAQAPPLVLRRLDGRRTDQHRAIRGWTEIPSI